MLTMASVKALFVCYCFLLFFFIMFLLRRSTERNTKTVYFFSSSTFRFFYNEASVIKSLIAQQKDEKNIEKVETKRQNKTTKVKKQNVRKTSSL